MSQESVKTNCKVSRKGVKENYYSMLGCSKTPLGYLYTPKQMTRWLGPRRPRQMGNDKGRNCPPAYEATWEKLSHHIGARFLQLKRAHRMRPCAGPRPCPRPCPRSRRRYRITRALLCIENRRSVRIVISFRVKARARSRAASSPRCACGPTKSSRTCRPWPRLCASSRRCSEPDSGSSPARTNPRSATSARSARQ
jgi:hypothetical protein